ncbi:MAG: hypothetical protein OXE77_01580 [Flavobacteriaceae bacterium]|nr:hypothetical protein [Flavobacteriaceae bacterium]MCY4268522.1 hypothetical protein [Flavobacteriaceae bacterium]
MKDHPATKQDLLELKNDIKDLLEPMRDDIKGIKSEVKELNTKFDIINHKLGRHGGFLWVYGIILAIILTGILNVAANIIVR